MYGNLILPILSCAPFVCALAVYCVGRFSKQVRDLCAQAVTAVVFAAAVLLFIRALRGGAPLSFVADGLCGGTFSLCLDGFRALYCLIAAFMWLMATLFSSQYLSAARNRNRYYLFLLATLGATLGVFLSADLFTTFLFFEIMSLTSYVWVAQEETPAALRAAGTYLAVAILGGLVMLFGVCLLAHLCGTLAYDRLGAQCAALLADPSTRPQLYLAGGCLLFGFGAKAGAFPLHIWLPKAHPVAPAPASALLSGILTKAGIFGVLILSTLCFASDALWGRLILLIGLVTMALGAVLALFSIDLKRTLACSSVSQIGFILFGAGLLTLPGAELGLAARGTLLHMVNHSLLKLTLFLAAGAVYMNVHALDLNDIRGFGRKKPLLRFVFLMGALGIGGVPLWNGYLSKTLLHEALLEARALTGAEWMTAAEWVFLVSGGLTVAYMTKLYFALFVESNANPARQARFDRMTDYLSPRSAFALVGSAVCLPLLGLLPHVVTDRIAALGEAFLGSTVMEPVAYFSFASLRGALLSIAIGAAVYLIVVRGWMMRDGVYLDRWPVWLDLENLVYRPLLLTVLPVVCGTVCRFLDRLLDGILVLLRRTVYRDSPLPYDPVEGTQLTEHVGGWIEALAAIFHTKSNARHRLAMLYDDFSENSTIIGRSLSFGLFMACLGLILILLYLLIL